MGTLSVDETSEKKFRDLGRSPVGFPSVGTYLALVTKEGLLEPGVTHDQCWS